MEITIVKCQDRVNDKFKIDLIVWKYEIKQEASRVKNLFKIDLIVWKLFAPNGFTSTYKSV